MLLFTGFVSYGQQQQDDKKKAEAKLSTPPVNTNSDKKPELKLVDHSTAKKEKVQKAQQGTPELKLVSK